MKLDGKVALITGAGSGFGKATSILFAKEGAKVIVVDINPEAANKVADIINQNGKEAISVKADVSQSRDCEAMIKSAVEKYGKLDILHNNAGMPTLPTLVENIDEAMWDRVIAVNLKSVFLGSKFAIPVMKQAGGGIIINTSSVTGFRPRPGYGAYTTSKAAVTHFTKSLAIELAPFKIRVNSISPVISETPLGLGLMTEDMKKSMEATRKFFLSTIPLGRMVDPEDVARSALFLASDDSPMCTGMDLLVDGGRAI